MPIYEYDCPVCGRIEAIQKVDERPLKECPQCLEKGKHSKVSKMVSSASFHLKGSGWYKTDYASSSSNGKAAKKSESSSTSSDSEKKSEAKPKSCGSGCGCH